MMNRGLAGVVLLLATLSARAQDPSQERVARAVPSKDEAPALLQRAAQTTSLLARGTLPFHLRASVKSFDHRGKATEGAYDLWWLEPRRWRAETRTGESTGVILLTEGHRWTRLTGQQKLIDLRLDIAFDVASGLRIYAGERITKVQRRDVGGAAANCFETMVPGSVTWTLVAPQQVVLPPFWRKLCLDAVGGWPVLKTEDRSAREFRYGEYTALGLRRFPTQVRYLLSGKPLLEARVESLEVLEKPDPAVFAPPSGAELWQACAGMVAPRALGAGSALADTNSANGAPLPGSGSLTSISYVIGTDGKIHDFEILDREGYSTMAEAQLQLWRQTSYEPAKCAGQPVAMQIIAELSADPQPIILTYLHEIP